MIQIVFPLCLSCSPTHNVLLELCLSTVRVSVKRTVQFKVHTHYRCDQNIMFSCLPLKCQLQTNPGTAVVSWNVTEFALGMRTIIEEMLY